MTVSSAGTIARNTRAQSIQGARRRGTQRTGGYFPVSAWPLHVRRRKPTRCAVRGSDKCHPEWSCAAYRTPATDEKYGILRRAPPEVAEAPWRFRTRSRVWPGCRREPRLVAGRRPFGPAEHAEQIAPLLSRHLPAAPGTGGVAW